MKKFLTVLLALSVVFTYTVGTAFAGTTPTVDQKQTAIETAQKAMSEAVSEYAKKSISYSKENIFTGAKGYDGDVIDVTGENLTKDAVEAGVAKFIENQKEEIKKCIKDLTNSDDVNTMRDELVLYYTNENIAKSLFANLELEAMFEKAITDAKAEAEAAINKYDPADYSEANATRLKNAVNTLNNVIDETNESTKAKLDALVSAIETFETATKDLPTTAKDAEKLEKEKVEAEEFITAWADRFAKYEKARLEDYKDSTDLEDKAAAELKLAALENNVATLLAFYNEKVAAVVIDDKTTATDATRELGAIKQAARTAFAAPNTNWSGDFYAAVEKLENVELLIAFANGYANQLKEKFDATTGLAIYNAATVDKKLAEIVADIEALKLTTTNAIKAALDKTLNAEDEATALAAAKTSAINTINAYKGVDRTGWVDERADAVEAIQKEYVAKVKVASIVEDIEQLVKDAKKAMGAYLTVGQMATVKRNTATAMTTLGYSTTLEEYARGIVAKDKASYSDYVVEKTVEAAETLLYDAVLAENKVDLTQAQIKQILKDNYGKALAVIDGIKTDAEIKATADAIVAAIEALPETVTLADKAQYLDVQTMLENYIAVPGATFTKVTNFAKFRTYMTKVVLLERNAVEGLIRALPTTVTVDSKDTIEAARAAYDAYKDAYKDYDAANTKGFTYGYVAPVNGSVLAAKEAALSNAMMLDAAKKIAALPAVITLDDKAAVEAARAAYDELTAEQKEVFAPALYAKLVAAEKQLIAEEAKAVEGTHVKIKSEASKGYIRISWDQKDMGVKLDGYEVYRSTSKTGEFKKISEFKVQKSKKYTKLTKGQKYFYMVKGYKMVNGERVYTHNSITVYRTFK